MTRQNAIEWRKVQHQNRVIIMKESGNNSIMNNSGPWERPVSSRPKMPRSQRAKQFAPFDALTGLGERLKLAEEEHERDRERK